MRREQRGWWRLWRINRKTFHETGGRSDDGTDASVRSPREAGHYDLPPGVLPCTESRKCKQIPLVWLLLQNTHNLLFFLSLPTLISLPFSLIMALLSLVLPQHPFSTSSPPPSYFSLSTIHNQASPKISVRLALLTGFKSQRVAEGGGGSSRSFRGERGAVVPCPGVEGGRRPLTMEEGGSRPLPKGEEGKSFHAQEGGGSQSSPAQGGRGNSHPLLGA